MGVSLVENGGRVSRQQRPPFEGLELKMELCLSEVLRREWQHKMV